MTLPHAEARRLLAHCADIRFANRWLVNPAMVRCSAYCTLPDTRGPAEKWALAVQEMTNGNWRRNRKEKPGLHVVLLACTIFNCPPTGQATEKRRDFRQAGGASLVVSAPGYSRGRWEERQGYHVVPAACLFPSLQTGQTGERRRGFGRLAALFL
jgi:hypothetical protein